MNEFIIELQAKLDEAKSKENINSDIAKIQGQLDKLKIQAELDQDTISKLTKEIEKVINQKITISNIEVDVKSGTKAGQNYANQFNKGVSQGLKNNSSVLNTFKKSLENIGMGSKEIDKVAERVKNLNIQIESLTQSVSRQKGEESDKGILSVGISGIDEMGQAIKLTEQYNASNGDLIKSIDAVSTAQKKADTATDNFIKKQKRMLSNKQNTINQITSNAFDKNASNPITSVDSLGRLSAQTDKIEKAMNSLRNSTRETFDDAVLKVNEEISAFKILERELRRADNVSDKLKGTDTSSGISIAKNRLDKFKSDAKEFPQIKKTIEELDESFSNVGDAESLNRFNDQLKVAKAELEKIKTETNVTLKELEKSYQQINDLQIKKSTLDPIADKNKISNLNDEISIAQNKYSNILNSANKNSNFDITIWKERKKAIDSVTKSKIEYNNTKLTDSLENTKSGLSSTLSSLKSSLQENGVYTDDLKEKIQSLETELSKISNQGDLSVFKNSINEVSAEAKKMIETVEQAKKIKNLQETNKISLKMDKTSSTYEELKKLNILTDDLKEDFIQLKVLYEAIGKSNSDEELVNTYRKFDSQLQKVNNSLESIKLKTPSISKELSEVERNTFKHQVEAWIRINSNAKEFHGRMREILAQLDLVDTNTAFQKLKKDFKEINAEASAAGVKGKSFIDTFKNGVQSFTEWTFGSSAVMQIMNGIKNMGHAVYDVDTSMTNLYKVTDETESKYSEFLINSGKNAKDLGRNLSSTIEQTANWAKLGFSLNEAEKLAKTSSIYSNVGEVDDNTAVSDIVTAIKAFNIEASDSITIVDSLNKLGNEFATDAASLGEGLSKSASALHLAGNDINETLAMLTGGTEITQNASEMGNALKVLSMRVRGMKGELEELGEEYENVESISKIQTQILNQTHGHVNIFDENGNFKSTYEILKGISEIYDHISQTDQAALLETIAGKQRGNQIAALIQAFQSGQIEKAYEASANAAGSAMQEQERWMQSLEAKTQQFQAAFQTLSNTVIDSDLLKFFVDLGTGAVSALDGITGSIGSLGTIGLGAGLFAGVKNTGKCRISVRIS